MKFEYCKQSIGQSSFIAETMSHAQAEALNVFKTARWRSYSINFVKLLVCKILNFRQMSFKGNIMRKTGFLRTFKSVYGCLCAMSQICTFLTKLVMKISKTVLVWRLCTIVLVYLKESESFIM